MEVIQKCTRRLQEGYENPLWIYIRNIGTYYQEKYWIFCYVVINIIAYVKIIVNSPRFST